MKHRNIILNGSRRFYLTRIVRTLEKTLTGIMFLAKSRLLWLVIGLFFLASVLGLPAPVVAARLLADAPTIVQDPNEGDVESSKSSAFNRVGIYVVGFGCAVLLIATISVVAVLYLRHKRKMTTVSPWRQGMSGQLQREPEIIVPLLEREALEVACEDFSNIIGSSPDCVVYKGTLPDGTEIAATSIQMSAANWPPHYELSFRKKVKALARMKHPHLVNFIGYCTKDDPWTRIFVFEYASNGSLYDHLHNKESEHLGWTARMRLVVGAAIGLKYMHHELVPPVHHSNFSAESVLLTDDYAAKVSTFGVTGVPMMRNDSQKSSWFAGKTSGHENGASIDHLDPDFENDIYSFGVFLLEVITGRPPETEGAPPLVEWAREYLSDPKMMWYMVDPTLKPYNHDELVAVCKVASMCLSTESPRPSLLRICDMLTDNLKLSPDVVAAKSPAALWAQLELHDDSSSEVST